MFRMMLTIAVLLNGSLGCSDGQQPVNTVNSQTSEVAIDPKSAEAESKMKKLEWMQYDAENKGRKLRVRLRPDVGIIDDRLATVVVVKWMYEGDQSSLPTPDVKARMDELETALRPLGDQDRFSRLLMTTEGLGQAEWVFYVKDYPQFEAEFNEHVKGLGPFPIELGFSRDADWSYVHSMQARLLTVVEEKAKAGLPTSRLDDK